MQKLTAYVQCFLVWLEVQLYANRMQKPKTKKRFNCLKPLLCCGRHWTLTNYPQINSRGGGRVQSSNTLEPFHIPTLIIAVLSINHFPIRIHNMHFF
jgi:hypothetical protein